MLWLQCLLFLTFILGFNFLSAKSYIRKDLTQKHRYSLSPESVAYIKQLDKPIHIFVTVPKNSPKEEVQKIFDDVSHLLKEYQYVARAHGKSIRVEYLDVYQQRKRTEEIAKRYDLRHENTIVVTCEDRSRQVFASDLYNAKDGTIEAFKGEQVFTSALLNVSEAEKQKIYCIVGHGELQPKSIDPVRGFSRAVEFLQQRNFDVKSLDLIEYKQIPEDASIVLLVSPQTKLLPYEVSKLRQYLASNGRLALFLDPLQPHGLDDLLFEWGILVDDKIVIDVGEDFKSSGGDLILRNFSDHAITQLLKNAQLPLLWGLTRPARPDPGASNVSLKRTPLIFSSEKSFAKSNYANLEDLTFDPDKDIPGPLAVATLSEKNIDSEFQIKLPGSRLLVFGNADFLANNRFDVLGNKLLFSNVAHGMIDRDRSLNIPPKPIDAYQLTLSRKQLLLIALNFSILPASILLLGIVVYLLRRR
ncbi:MAG: hypothetical protein A2Y14_02005 [Verrucomicrobia bacterium GWF2_51_19]|nr:MAG: hypothetical protein A2Y14_02005 [Verrucomicrobia bacterium GWF2_51_19]